MRILFECEKFKCQVRCSGTRKMKMYLAQGNQWLDELVNWYKQIPE